MASTFLTSNVYPILDTNQYHRQFQSFQTASPNAVADPDAVAKRLWEEVPSFGSREAFPVDRESIKERSIQGPEVKSKHIEGSGRMLDKLEHLWEGFEDCAYKKVSSVIYKRWTTSALLDKQFLERAVDLLAEFQKRPMRNMKDSLEWLEHLGTSGIDSKKYLGWVDEQYELLAREKRNGFEDITLEKALNSLRTANWKEANDESAIVNAYLLNTKVSSRPEISLGRLGNFLLAVRMNGECIRPQKIDSRTVKSPGVTTINPDIFLSIRYKLLKKPKSINLLFIPIGNLFHMKCSGKGNDASIFREGEWQDTGIVLVLNILRKIGTMGKFYLARDLRSSKLEDDQGDAAIPESLGTKPFSLAKVMNEDDNDDENHFKLLSEVEQDWTETPMLKLKRVSNSELEIVQTGEKGDWSEGYPPVGLYPDLGND